MPISKEKYKKLIRFLLFGLLGGTIYAVIDRAGYMIYKYQTIWVVSDNPLHKTLIHRALCRMPFYTLVVLLLMAAVTYISKYLIHAKKMQDKKYSFFILWGIVFLCWIPAFLGCYPGIFAADAPNQIFWYNCGDFSAHHPVLHTLLLMVFWSLGKIVFESETFGIALYTFFQMIVLSGCYAYVLKWMQKRNVSVWGWAVSLLFFCFHPMHAMNSVFATKDILFSGFLSIYLTKMIDLFESPARIKEKSFFVQLVVWLFLCLAFRNNMLYAFVVFAPIMLIALRKYWKQILLLIGCSLACFMLFTGPVYKIMGVTSGNSREAYSVIMQTLARTYVWPNAVLTEEELEIITPVLEEEVMSNYMPTLSDPVKAYFDTEAFEENKFEFLKCWLRVGKREYKTYVDAFLTTTYGFWAMQPTEVQEVKCTNVYPEDDRYPHVFLQPINEAFHDFYVEAGKANEEAPAYIAVFFKSASYVWFAIFVILYVLYRKDYHSMLLWLLPALYFLTFLLGPCATFRYFYAIFALSPMLLIMLLEPFRFRRIV